MSNHTASVLNSVRIEQTGVQPNPFLDNRFLAPHVAPGGSVKTRAQGRLYNFQVEQCDFEGWGIFQPLTSKLARLTGEAARPMVEHYLSRFPQWEMRLVRKLRGQTWLAYARQAKGRGPRTCNDWFNPSDGPMTVQLVEDAKPFGICHARFDGHSMWFEEPGCNREACQGEALSTALDRGIKPGDVRIPGLTHFDRSAYSLAFHERYSKPRVLKLDHARNAQSMTGEHWTIQWIDSRADLRTSTIIERDLNVVSAGICLTTPDQFDLASLVGVLEQLA